MKCNICNVSSNTQDQLRIHINSQKHINQKKRVAEFDALSRKHRDIIRVVYIDSAMYLQCNCCDIKCTCADLMGKHLVSKPHLKKLSNWNFINVNFAGLNTVHTQDIVETSHLLQTRSNQSLCCDSVFSEPRANWTQQNGRQTHFLDSTASSSTTTTTNTEHNNSTAVQFQLFSSSTLASATVSAADAVTQPLMPPKAFEAAATLPVSSFFSILSPQNSNSISRAPISYLSDKKKMHCALCNIVTDTLAQMQFHAGGKQHQKRAKMMSTTQQQQQSAQTNDNTSGMPVAAAAVSIASVSVAAMATPPPNLAFCECCNLALDISQMSIHKAGRQHRFNSGGITSAAVPTTISTTSNYSQPQAAINESGMTSLQQIENLPVVKKALRTSPHSHSRIEQLLCTQLADTPRLYQLELYRQAMRGDSLVFLPTGTGKTLVACMVMLHMLAENPRHQAVFLVDRVLLMLQQYEAIRQQLGHLRVDRFNFETNKLERRKLRIIGLCAETIQSDNYLPIADQDVFICTAAFYHNLLNDKKLSWTRLCIAVFDEAHNCVKQHPFNLLLKTFHNEPKFIHSETSTISTPILTSISTTTLSSSSSHQLAYQIDPKKQSVWQRRRPKLLALTASPAGNLNLPDTEALMHRLKSLGGAELRVAVAQQHADELDTFTCTARVEPVFVEFLPVERQLRIILCEYIHALLSTPVLQLLVNHLHPHSLSPRSSPSLLPATPLRQTSTREDRTFQQSLRTQLDTALAYFEVTPGDTRILAPSKLEEFSEFMNIIFDSLAVTNDDLIAHFKLVLKIVQQLDSAGFALALRGLNVLFSTNKNRPDVYRMSFAALKQRCPPNLIKRVHSQLDRVDIDTEDALSATSLVQQLVEEINKTQSEQNDSASSSTILVLVRERILASSLASFLQEHFSAHKHSQQPYEQQDQSGESRGNIQSISVLMGHGGSGSGATKKRPPKTHGSGTNYLEPDGAATAAASNQCDLVDQLKEIFCAENAQPRNFFRNRHHGCNTMMSSSASGAESVNHMRGMKVKQQKAALEFIKARQQPKPLSKEVPNASKPYFESLRADKSIPIDLQQPQQHEENERENEKQNEVQATTRTNQIVVSTSVCAEGIDLPKCSLVVLLNPPTSVQALVQIRGRARAAHSRLVILCRSERDLAALQQLQQREQNMRKAVHSLFQLQQQQQEENEEDEEIEQQKGEDEISAEHCDADDENDEIGLGVSHSLPPRFIGE